MSCGRRWNVGFVCFRFLGSSSGSGRSASPSGYRGVSWDASSGKWTAKVAVSGARSYLGVFNLAEDAAHAYDDFIRSSGTSMALLRRLNFPTHNETTLLAGAAPQSSGARRHCYEIEALSKRLLEEGLDRTSWDLMWMPEGTRADGALRPKSHSSSDSWVGIQLKAASRPNASGVYTFGHLLGYHGMLIICIALDRSMLWALPGAAVTVQTMAITIGGKWDRYRCSWCQLGAILACAWIVRETFIRHSLASLRLPASLATQVELSCLDDVEQTLEEVGLSSSSPAVQHGSVDMLVEARIRVQCKARTAPTRSVHSFCVGLTRRLGSRSKVPYFVGDFDALLACLIFGDRLKGFFVIPARELASRGFLCPIKWRTSITLYLPQSTPRTANGRLAKAWQSEYFVSTEGGLDEAGRARLRRLMLACSGDDARCDERAEIVAVVAHAKQEL